MTKREYKDLLWHLLSAGNEPKEIDDAINFIKNAVNDNDWVKHVTEVVAGIEIERQILINMFLK